jgi:2-iminobutanoate/2-iminopropanoate deaminase
MLAGMHRRTVSSTEMTTTGTYSAGVEIGGPGRTLYVSGQVPETADGHVPDDFTEQCRLAWRNVGVVLENAGMTYTDLVKVTTFLSGREYRDRNAKVRDEVLGDHQVALTVIITGIYEERWLLEIEAVAAA